MLGRTLGKDIKFPDGSTPSGRAPERVWLGEGGTLQDVLEGREGQGEALDMPFHRHLIIFCRQWTAPWVSEMGKGYDAILPEW